MAQNQGAVLTPNKSNFSPSSVNTVGMGRNGDALTSFLHGPWFNAAMSGAVFHGSTAAAGTIIPISSATAATFVLYNPPSSGVNVELLEYVCGTNNAALIVSAVMLGISPLNATAPATVTALTPIAGKIGAATPQALLYSVATIVATTSFYHMLSFSATAGLADPPPYEFAGGLILPPGTFAHVCGTAAQTQAMAQRLSWAEWPV